MKLAQVAAMAAFAANLVHGHVLSSSCYFRDTDNPETGIHLWKYDSDKCKGVDGDDNDSHFIEHGDCHNFDYAFSSFRYTEDPGYWGDDDDWEDCRCYVIAYPEQDCGGKPYCLGPLIDGLDHCISLAGLPKGQSIKVACDNENPEGDNWATCKSSPILEHMWH